MKIDRLYLVCSQIALLAFGLSGIAFPQCSSPANAIVAENCLPGNPSSDWDIAGSGDPSIQGFATDISVNAGQTINFKVNTNASSYSLQIYRMGYYGGLGARLITTISPSARLPQSQPACLTDATTKLLDCGNWAVSASWTVPANAVSGVYLVHLVRADTGGDSHIVFIVRNDASHSDILFQTADETWQAYNNYGGFSIYGDTAFNLPNRAFKISYNRPFNTRSFESLSWIFHAEYPMIRWLEANGYDVSYFTGVDAARNGTLITQHKSYVTAGHDEYWSGPQRSNVEAARSAGVHMAFFTGNEVFWKVRWENAIDGSGVPYRTLVCYKETLSGAKVDPSPTWTGTWRDPRFSPPSDGGRPENALTGTAFLANGPGADNTDLSILVPAADGKMRFWRNTSIASLATGQTATLPAGTLGYEWDVDLDNGARPAGAFGLSTATYNLTTDLLLDYGATYGAGPATHRLMMYRAPSGALVFGAGTVQWSWGLDATHDDGGSAVDSRMQQATVNLFADMGVQPATIQSGLLAATKSTDVTPPASSITAPAGGSTVTGGAAVTISGTAVDYGGGLVGGVEVSVDGGTTWHPASGRASWTYSWVPKSVGTVTIKSRAVDDSGNLEQPLPGNSVTVAAHDCPCNSWIPATTPALTDSGDGSQIEVGVKFRTDYNGYITGIRFYKSTANTGTHIGNLWSSTGTLLASASFVNETASGWQQVNFTSSVPVVAGTTYVASYFAPVGHYSADTGYFATSGIDNPPLHFLANGVDGPNGVYRYGSSGFPTSTYNSTNYWVDVVYIPSGSMPGAPAAVLAVPVSLSFNAYRGQPAPPAQTASVYNQGSGVLSWTATPSASWIVVSPSSGSTPASLSISVNPAGLTAGTYNGTISISAPGGNNSPQTISVSLTLSDVLLSSTFSSGTTEGWAFSPLGLAANWSVVNQVLQYNGGGHTQVYSGNSAWTNYTVQAAVKLSNLSDYPGGIRGRVNQTSGASYAVWLYPAEGLIRLYRTVAWDINTGFVQLGQATAAFDSQNAHTVALSFQGSQITVSYNGATIITATDATYASGMIALDVSNQPVGFSNVLVTAFGNPAASLTPTPTSLSFTGTYLGANPAAQTVGVSASSGVLVWTAVSTATWLTVSGSNGITPANLTASVNMSGLLPGTYNGTLRLTSLAAANNPQTVNVTLTVVAPPPSIVAAPANMKFSALVGQPNPAAQNLNVTNGSGYGSFSWTVSTDSAWLLASPGSGSTPSTISVSVNPNGLAPGSYSGNVIVSAAGVANSPRSVPVSLTVSLQDMAETFSNGANGWIISPMGLAGGWTAASGTYTFNGSGLSQSCAGNSAWSNYSFDTNIRLSTLNNWPGGVRGRVNPNTGAGYVLWLYPGSGLAVLYRVSQWDINGPGLTTLAQAPLTFDTAAYHDLQMSFNGSQISISWDGNPLMTVADSTYSSGYVCLDADSQPISYQNVRVAGTQSPVTLTATPSALTFNALPGAAPAAQNVSIAAGGAATTWAIKSSSPWLGAAASSVMTPGTITVSVSPAGLAEGTYNGTVTVYAPGATNGPLAIPVTLAVKTAVLTVAPGSLAFFGATTANPAAQNLSITNSGTGALNWTASPDSAWIGLSALSGAAPSSLAVTANSSSLAVGQYSGTITINSGDVANGPVIVPVSLAVGTPLFSDNFSNGAGNWTISPLGNGAGWTVGNGLYSYNGQGATQSWAGSASWTNYAVAADFQLSSLNDYPGGIRGRLNTTTGSGYGVWIYPAERILKLYRIGQWNIDSGFALLGQSGVINIDAAHLHNIRLSFNGSQISVYYDNALVLQATDATYAQGAIAFDVSNQPIGFTNVNVIGF